MKKLSMKERALAAVQSAAPIAAATLATESGRVARTGPGTMMAHLAKESSVLKDNEQLKAQIQELSVDLANANRTKLENIVLKPHRKRQLTEAEYAELKANISKNGIESPLVVTPLGSGRYELISGHNRYEILVELGETEAPIHIKNYASVVEAEKGAFYTNLLQHALPDYEKYLGFKRIKEETGMTQEQMAADAGLSVSTVSYVMEFDKLPAEALALIDKHRHSVSYTTLRKLKGLPNVTGAIQALCERGASLAEAVALAKGGAAKEKPGKKPLLIKSGRTHVAEVVHREGVVSIRCKDKAFAADLMNGIEAFIRSKITS